MTTADVIKLACAFVEDVISYIKETRYLTDPCLDNVSESFSRYKQATTLVECLTHEDECDILGYVTNPLPYVPPVVLDCDTQITIELSQTSTSCSYWAQPRSVIVGALDAFPVIILEDDTVHQPAFIKMELKTDCGTIVGSQILESGCDGNDIGPLNCNDALYKGSYGIGFEFDGVIDNPDGYIKTLRVYETDVNGLLNPIPIDLNVAPSNIAAWTSCPLCSGVDPNDLLFDSPSDQDWKAAFETLMENVSYTRYGALNSNFSFFKGSGNPVHIRFTNKIKHNPLSNWMGFNKDDFYFEYVNDAGDTIPSSDYNFFFNSGKHTLVADYSIPTPCGNTTGRYKLQNVFHSNVAIATSNFNFLSLTNPKLSKNGVVVNESQVACTKTTLTAVLTVLSTLDNFQWRDPLGAVITTTELVIEVEDSGIYTFEAILENGCSLSKTITV